MVSIEVEDKLGHWQRYTIVSANAVSIVKALKEAIESELASESTKARAVDLKTGQVIDLFASSIE